MCPNDSCNHLYSLEEAQMLKVCNVITFGSKSWIYFLKTFSQQKWHPYKVYYFIAPSVWLKTMFHKKEFRDLVLSPHESTLGIQDIYDADMWKTFLFNRLDNTEAFLSDPKNY